MAYSTALRDACDPCLRPMEDVSARAMFGGHCYLVRGRMFVILSGERLMIRPGPGDGRALVERFGGEPWTPRPGMKFGAWIAVPCPGDAFEFVEGLAPFLENACEARRRDAR